MQYNIIYEQDYSNRFAGSWGYVTVNSPDRVDEMLLADSDFKVVVVEGADETPLTGEMDAPQWNAWKEQNKPLLR